MLVLALALVLVLVLVVHASAGAGAGGAGAGAGRCRPHHSLPILMHYVAPHQIVQHEPSLIRTTHGHVFKLRHRNAVRLQQILHALLTVRVHLWLQIPCHPEQ